MTLIEQVKNLEAEKVALIAAAAQVSANLTEASAQIDGLTAKIDAQDCNITELSTELTASIAAFAAEQSAHKATKESVESQASIKAQQILASAGHKPVDFKATGDNSIQEKIKAAKPGAERMKLLVQNFDYIRKHGFGN